MRTTLHLGPWKRWCAHTTISVSFLCIGFLAHAQNNEQAASVVQSMIREMAHTPAEKTFVHESGNLGLHEQSGPAAREVLNTIHESMNHETLSHETLKVSDPSNTIIKPEQIATEVIKDQGATDKTITQKIENEMAKSINTQMSDGTHEARVATSDIQTFEKSLENKMSNKVESTSEKTIRTDTATTQGGDSKLIAFKEASAKESRKSTVVASSSSSNSDKSISSSGSDDSKKDDSKKDDSKKDDSKKDDSKKDDSKK